MATIAQDTTENELNDTSEYASHEINVGEVERALSVVAGAALITVGLSRRGLGGVAITVLGSAFLHRGMSGHCFLRAFLAGLDKKDNNDTDTASILHKGIRVDETIVVERRIEDLYPLWRDISGLPQFMKHVESITPLDDNCYRWRLKGPIGTPIEWDSEVYSERTNELIAWRSLDNSMIAMAGAVRFRETPTGTEVRVLMDYDPLLGRLGASLAAALGESPAQMIANDLKLFKAFAENRLPTQTGAEAPVSKEGQTID